MNFLVPQNFPLSRKTVTTKRWATLQNLIFWLIKLTKTKILTNCQAQNAFYTYNCKFYRSKIVVLQNCSPFLFPFLWWEENFSFFISNFFNNKKSQGRKLSAKKKYLLAVIQLYVRLFGTAPLFGSLEYVVYTF